MLGCRMSVEHISVLVVDDHEAWRTVIREALQRLPKVRVVGEAADGAEAIRLAHGLSPDLVLLDVGLPSMSGIEAAERIMARNRQARVLFASNYSEWEIVDAALRTGARGYMLKTSAAQELQSAVDRISSGGWFIAPARGGRPVDPGSHLDTSCHRAAFYTHAADRIDEYARYIANALLAGRAVLGCVNDECRSRLQQRLASLGVDLDADIANERFVAFDIPELMSAIMEGDRIVDAKFYAAAMPMLLAAARAASGPQPGISAFGDGASSLWKRGLIDAAIRLEQLWDEMAGVFNLDILCGYEIDAASGPGADRLAEIHAHVTTRRNTAP
jgi:CheY-like chemotaxis protein